MKTSVNNYKKVIDIPTAKVLMKTDPLKIYKVSLGKGMVVEMRLHLANLKDKKVKALKSAQECFKEGWQAAISGKTKPISELWD